MARDYAKYNTKKPILKSKKQNLEIYIVILLLAVIFVIGYWLYTHKIKGTLTQSAQVTHAVANLQAFFQYNKKHTIPKESPPKKDEVRFDFYNELPNMQMTISSAFNRDKKIKKENFNPSPSPKVSYSVLLGKFKDLNAATQMRISLLLVGVESEIIKDGPEYKLKHGPFKTISQAKTAQQKLAKKGFESEVAKV